MMRLANTTMSAWTTLLGISSFLYLAASYLRRRDYLRRRENLTRVTVLLRMLPEDHPGAGFLGTLDWTCGLLWPDTYVPREFATWLTHFSLLLEYGSGDRYILERIDDAADGGVVHRRLDNSSADEAVVNSIATVEWVGIKRRLDVERFAGAQMKTSYSFLMNNCQHFAYMFFKDVLNDVHARGRFEDFTSRCQALFREREKRHDCVQA